jgi:ribosome-associated protein
MKTLSTLARKKLVIAALEDIKARDIQAIDVRRLTAVFDWIVVASAESARQTKALARHVRDELRAAGCTIVGSEGEETGEWILVDAGDIVAHVMQPAVRAYYNLEELWGEGRFDKVVNSSAPVPGRARRVTTKVTKGTKKAKATKVRKAAKVPKAKSGVRRKRRA